MTVNFQVSEWIKGKLIGSGSFGQVHVAMNTINGYVFVVKSSHFGVGIKPLENEAKVLAKLKNAPHIVQYLGKDITSGPNNECILNVFMEHMGGGSLFDVMNNFGGKLLERVVRSYTRQILEGVNYLHENGIVHCDIKCKNILLDSRGNVKIADFGCADFTNYLPEEDTNNSKILKHKQYVGGTPLWMAPEILRGERPNTTSDIWSLGCTIIEMATGKPPNWGNSMANPMTTLLEITTSDKRPQFPTDFSCQGLHFLELCLQRDPKKRFTAKELLKHPFISNNNNTVLIKGNLIKGHDALSPASVLDIGSFDMNFSDEEEEEYECGVFYDVPMPNVASNPIKHHFVRHTIQGSFLDLETNFKTFEKWVTVRSIDNI